MLAGLPRSYHTFVTSFSNQAEKDLPELVSRLCYEEDLQNRYNKRRPEEANSAENSRGQRANRGKGGRDARNRGKSNRSQDNKERKGCYIYHVEGHNFYDCPKFDPDYKSEKEKEKKRGNVERKENKKDKDKKNTSKKDETGMVAEEANYSCSSGLSNWIIDTGASSHMSYDRGEFHEYHELEDPKVIRFAGTQRGYGIWVGRVKINTIVNGVVKEEILNDVIHVPDLRRKLFSLNAAMNRGCRGEFIDDKIIIKGPDNRIKLIARRTNSLY